MKKLLLFLIITIFPLSGFCDETRSNFLSHGPSVSAYGRGDAGTADTNDISCVYYNPALLANIRQTNIGFSYYSLYEGSKYSFAGFGKQIGKSYLGVSAINLRSGDIAVTQTISDAPTFTNTSELACYLSCGRYLDIIGTNVGLSLKYLSQTIYNYSGNGIGTDIGLSKVLEAPEMFGNESKFNLGLNLQNVIVPKIKLVSQEEEYPLAYRFGASLDMQVFERSNSVDVLSLLADFVFEGSKIKYFTGLEYRPLNNYFLRAGYYSQHITAGAGFKIKNTKIDYSFDTTDYTSFHRVGINFYFNNVQKKEKKEVKVKPIIENSLMAEAQSALNDEEKRQDALEKEIDPLFNEAKDNYDKSMYLKASESFKSMIMKYPHYETAKKFFKRIDKKIRKLANVASTDLENLSYATAYVNYYEGNYAKALNDWEKVLQLNPNRFELTEYVSKIKAYLADKERQEKEQKAYDEVNGIYSKAVKDFELGAWVNCIKGMEQVQELCKQSQFPKAYEFNNEAQEHIDKSLKELAKTIKKKEHKQQPKVQEQVIEYDIQGSAKKYNEGLILYAQGKAQDAMRLWDVAMRLNPANEKARKALIKVKEELGISENK